jgi:hypothetical protein
MLLRTKNFNWIVTIAILGLCMFGASHLVFAQVKGQWQRAYTGDGSVIEVNTSTLKFAPDRVLRAEFRTVFSHAESTVGDRAVKYKTRLETIDFRLSDRRYRFVEISLLDSGGKPVQTKTTDGSEDWRVLKPGGVTERLFTAASALTPLGAWKVVAYRLAEGEPKKAKPAPELDKLVGTTVRLHIDRAEVGSRVCYSPSFEDNDAQEESLRKLGVDWKSIGVKPEDSRTISVRCEASGWQPSQSLLIKDNSKQEMLMLWDGVFLVLKKAEGDAFRTTPGMGLPTLKRKEPRSPA